MRALLFLFASSCLVSALDPRAAVESAHGELWRRFIDKHGIMIDFTDLDGRVNLPTPEECREGKPNALGWFQPIENGAMFNGLYMDGAILRWQHTQSVDDAAKARRLMEGLLLLNSISEVKGFVGRGVSTDGRSHYAMGSNDQTLPWFVGLWRYWASGIATEAERRRIARHVVDTAEAIIALGWRMPAEAPFGHRGSFEGFHFEEVARKLFTLRLLHVMTQDATWDAQYRAELERRGGEEGLTKREVCQRGMKFFYAKTHNWTSCTGVAALRGLWELESDAAVKTIFEQGLCESARLAAESLPLAQQFDPENPLAFSQDWRAAMMPLWKPQATEHEASALAIEQVKAFQKISPQRIPECNFLREPMAAAWIVTLCPDGDLVARHRSTIEEMIGRYDYAQLYYCTFFWAECAWWRLSR